MMTVVCVCVITLKMMRLACGYCPRRGESCPEVRPVKLAGELLCLQNDW